MPKISVIVPVYKVEKYLKRCVDSILNQTYTDFELVLVDDGSPDNSGKLCDEYAQKDGRIQVIHKENGGISSARNAGIDWVFAHSNSDFFTFIDSDDAIKSNYLYTLSNYAQKNNADVVACKAIRVYNDDELKTAMNTFTNPTQPYRIYNGKEACINLYKTTSEISISPCTKLYKRDLFQNIRFPVGKIHEDQAVVPLLIYSTKKVVAADDVIYCYCCNSESIMGKPFYPKRFDDIDALQSCEEFFMKKKEDEIVKLIARKKQSILAIYNLKARKYNVYKMIPDKYKISIFSAWKQMDKLTRNAWILEQVDYYKHAPNRFLMKFLGDKNYAKLKAIFKRG